MKKLLLICTLVSIIATSFMTSCTESGSDPLTKLTALEFARELGYGINLGNTMEACDLNNRVPLQDPSVYEQMWGNPITTQEMIDGKRVAGFKTLRLPVAWTNAMNFAVNNELDYENWDFTISDAYLDRVEEIINYALNADMYVIVNNHWDHGWWSMFGSAEQEVRDIAMELYETMWTQVAERYNKFDNRVVFESANEELGKRLNDKTPMSRVKGVLTDDECYEWTTIINQRFIDIVRGTGGNNTDRFLLVKGFNTDVEMTLDERFVMPNDPSGRLLLGVHYYTPWSYCGDTSGVGGWGTTDEVEEMNRLLGSLTKFTEQGYGIVLGEWGVLDNVGEDRFDYFTNFLNLCDKYGFAPILWDTGNLYCRETNQIMWREANGKDPAIDLIIRLFRRRCPDERADMSVEEIIGAAEAGLEAALKKAAERPQFVLEADEAFAWIMFNSSDYLLSYSVGDQYRPENITAGITAADAEVTEGEGIYTVSLDFTGTEAGYSDGIAFAALGIVNGEILFPGYVIDVIEILINGEPANLSGRLYTTNDNLVTTRINLYNEWVNPDNLPDEARTADGNMDRATPIPLSNYIAQRIETLEITFEYVER
jgi:endoglucanase